MIAMVIEAGCRGEGSRDAGSSRTLLARGELVRPRSDTRKHHPFLGDFDDEVKFARKEVQLCTALRARER